MSYSRVAAHRWMLFDDHRNAIYGRAIDACAGPGSVVMDLGAGLGLHGLMAARAGARVYLVEPEPVVQKALDVARAAGLADRVHVVQERIEDASIGEAVDVIVSVFTGNLLFSEDLLPSLFLARDRHLKRDGTLLPDRAQLWMAPLHAPALHDKYIGVWSRPTGGFDYSAGRVHAANELLALRREEFTATMRLGEGAPILDLDLHRASNADCDATLQLPVSTTQSCHGLLAWTRMHVGNEWLSTDPDDAEVHWSPVFLPLDPPLPLRAGETLQVSLRRPVGGDWTWSAAAASGTRRHSTFLAAAQGSRELARTAPSAKPQLSPRGLRARRSLELFASGATVLETAETVARESGLPLPQVLLEVQGLALRHGDAG